MALLYKLFGSCVRELAASAFHIWIAYREELGLASFWTVWACERSREEFSHRKRAAAARQPEQSIMTSPLQRWGLRLRSVAWRRAPCKVGWDYVTSLWCTQVAHTTSRSPTLDFSPLFSILYLSIKKEFLMSFNNSFECKKHRDHFCCV